MVGSFRVNKPVLRPTDTNDIVLRYCSRQEVGVRVCAYKVSVSDSRDHFLHHISCLTYDSPTKTRILSGHVVEAFCDCLRTGTHFRLFGFVSITQVPGEGAACLELNNDKANRQQMTPVQTRAKA